ncbi:MAG TPA: hypothetical protein VGH87_23105 [Polyangiaceae bacterium]
MDTNWRFFALTLLFFACQNDEVNPPFIPDFDGSGPISPGNGTSNDGGTGEGGEAGALSAASNPKGIFVSNGSVYYTNFASGSGDGTVSVIATTGGTPTDLVTGLTSPAAIAVASGTVYFTLDPTSGTGGVSSVPAGGGSVTSIQTSVTGAAGIAVDATNVYWTTENSGAFVWFVPLAGGTPKQVLDFGGALTPTGLVIDTTDVFVPTDGPQAAVLAGTTSGSTNLTPLDTQSSITYADVGVSATTVYAIVDDIAPAGAVVSFPRAGGPQKTVVTGLNHPQHLVLDGTNLYFTDPDGGNVWLVDLTQATPAAVQFATGLNLPLPIAVADALYVGDADAIVRIPKL